MNMMNSLCGSTGSIKSENSCDSIGESKNKTNVPSSDHHHLEQNSLNLPGLNLPAIKFELDGINVDQVQSPDSSLWETFFSDHFDSDFMIMSPVRNNLPNSPQLSSYNNNVQGIMQGMSLSGCSPPRFSSQFGSFSSTHHKGKGQSPLHRVFNSPNNQFMQVESLSLPAIEEFLDDDYQKDGYGEYPTTKISAGVGSTSNNNMFEIPNTVPAAMLDCMSSMAPNSSRFCVGSASETSSSAGSSQLTQQDQQQFHQVNSVSGAPLSQQLQQEQKQEKQQNQNLGHTLTVPIPVGAEQVL